VGPFCSIFSVFAEHFHAEITLLLAGPLKKMV
jgi:hypothetical protein